MNKLYVVIPVSLSLGACSTVGNNNSAEEANKPPEMMHHSQDTKGSNYFPSRRFAQPATPELYKASAISEPLLRIRFMRSSIFGSTAPVLLLLSKYH